ncbi:pancreatic triacylglycerol lipase-like [Tropilaelaps mercedesae]|uniref:Pancreatic triacylglycerol lipase-like n=1 Tax=Tropilaelaps mercedesae TaxID=418985 RepID=A0A1V9X5L8_9ACAR|nr:pancreatic triacylglycerol lipase-like [Tropilaelaps mercedesae]
MAKLANHCMIPLVLLHCMILTYAGLFSRDGGGCKNTTYYTEAGHEPINLGCPEGKLISHPWDPVKINASYRFYTKADQLSPTFILPWNHSFANDSESRCKDSQTVVAVIHGFTENPEESWIRTLRSNYFNITQPRELTFIGVNWTSAAKGDQTFLIPNYPQAASNVEMIGRLTAEFLYRLMSSCNLPETSLHLIGHSLGGQAVGQVSSWLHKTHGIKPGRVFASDPANVLFNGIHPDRSDTHFLLVFHTSVSPFSLGAPAGAVGVFKAIGDIDAYPNGGTLFQPACKGNNTFFCSHIRGYIYFNNMLANCNKNCDFSAQRCSSAMQAITKTCDGQKINRVCEFIEEKATRLAKSNDKEQNDIIYFTTDNDNLKIECE